MKKIDVVDNLELINLRPNIGASFAPLGHIGVLTLADKDEILVVPEIDPIVPGLQNYRIANLNAVSDVEFDDIAETFRALNDGEAVDRNREFLPGSLVLSEGFTVTLGKSATPNLGLSGLVSGNHATVTARQTGITFGDLHSLVGTGVSLHRNDIKEASVIDDPLLPNIYRDAIYDASLPVLEKHRANFARVSKDLNMFVNVSKDSGRENYIVELILVKNDRFPILNTPYDGGFHKVIIDPGELGATITAIYPSDTKTRPFIRNTETRQVSVTEAIAIGETLVNIRS